MHGVAPKLKRSLDAAPVNGMMSGGARQGVSGAVASAPLTPRAPARHVAPDLGFFCAPPPRLWGSTDQMPFISPGCYVQAGHTGSFVIVSAARMLAADSRTSAAAATC